MTMKKQQAHSPWRMKIACLQNFQLSFSVLSSHLTSTNSRIDFSLGRMECNGMAFQNPAMIDACKTWEVEKRHMQDAGMYRWRGVKRRTSLDSRQTRTRNIAQYYSPMILSMWPTSQVDISCPHCENFLRRKAPDVVKRTRGLFVRRGVDGVAASLAGSCALFSWEWFRSTDAKGDGSPSGVEGKGYSFGHAFLKRVIYWPRSTYFGPWIVF